MKKSLKPRTFTLFHAGALAVLMTVAALVGDPPQAHKAYAAEAGPTVHVMPVAAEAKEKDCDSWWKGIAL